MKIPWLVQVMVLEEDLGQSILVPMQGTKRAANSFKLKESYMTDMNLL